MKVLLSLSTTTAVCLEICTERLCWAKTPCLVPLECWDCPGWELQESLFKTWTCSGIPEEQPFGAPHLLESCQDLRAWEASQAREEMFVFQLALVWGIELQERALHQKNDCKWQILPCCSQSREIRSVRVTHSATALFLRFHEEIILCLSMGKGSCLHALLLLGRMRKAVARIKE